VPFIQRLMTRWRSKITQWKLIQPRSDASCKASWKRSFDVEAKANIRATSSMIGVSDTPRGFRVWVSSIKMPCTPWPTSDMICFSWMQAEGFFYHLEKTYRPDGDDGVLGHRQQTGFEA
jgi:hypothetical protein